MREDSDETDAIQSLTMQPNGSCVFSISDRKIKVFDLQRHTLKTFIPYVDPWPRKVVCLPDGWFVIFDEDALVRCNLELDEKIVYPKPPGKILQCMFTAHGAGRLVTASGNTCTIRDLSTLEPLLDLVHDTNVVRAAKLSKSGDRLLSIDGQDTLTVWQIPMGNRIAAWPFHTYGSPTPPRLEILLDPDGCWVITTSTEYMYLWDVEHGKRRWRAPNPSPYLESCVIGGQGQIAALRGHHDKLEIWDFITGQCLKRFPDVGSHDLVATFCPEGRTLILRDESTYGFEVINLGTGKRVKSARRHKTPIKKLLMHPDGQTLLTAGEREPIIMWDIKTGLPLTRLGHSPVRGDLVGDRVPMKLLIDDFKNALNRQYGGYRGAARAGDGDGEDYRDAARWIEAYWYQVDALDVDPSERREDLVQRLEALMSEVRTGDPTIAKRAVTAMLETMRNG